MRSIFATPVLFAAGVVVGAVVYQLLIYAEVSFAWRTIVVVVIAAAACAAGWRRRGGSGPS